MGSSALCKAYGSAMFMENCMRDWSEDIFFLELWEDLQARAAKSTPDKQLAGTMDIAQVASVTSASLIPDDHAHDNLDGALFDETANSYRLLCQKTEEVMVDHLVAQAKDELKGYLKLNQWASLDPSAIATPASASASATTPNTSTASLPTISPELVPALTLLSTHTSFLHRTLAPAVYRRIVRSTNRQLQSYLWDYVVLRHTFSLAGGSQFARDVGELFAVHGDAGGGGAERVKEACILLTLAPANETQQQGGGEGEGKVGGRVALDEVVRPVFEDNHKAREAMAKLGIRVLGVGEVREVLKRWVEAFERA